MFRKRPCSQEVSTSISSSPQGLDNGPIGNRPVLSSPISRGFTRNEAGGIRVLGRRVRRTKVTPDAAPIHVLAATASRNRLHERARPASCKTCAFGWKPCPAASPKPAGTAFAGQGPRVETASRGGQCSAADFPLRNATGSFRPCEIVGKEKGFVPGMQFDRPCPSNGVIPNATCQQDRMKSASGCSAKLVAWQPLSLGVSPSARARCMNCEPPREFRLQLDRDSVGAVGIIGRVDQRVLPG